MSGGLKLCGILIENTLLRDRIAQSIIGIGLNVNQAHFDANLKRAVSMRQLMQKEFSREALLADLVASVQKELTRLSGLDAGGLRESYQDRLFKRNQPQMFRRSSGVSFMGIIQGISDSGLLVVQLEDERLEYFDFKEIEYLLS